MTPKKQATTPERIAALESIRIKFKGNDAQTQRARLLEAMAVAAITTFEAMRYLDVYHVPARIKELRGLGYSILTYWRVVETEAGVLHRVGMYVLQSGGAHAQP